MFRVRVDSLGEIWVERQLGMRESWRNEVRNHWHPGERWVTHGKEDQKKTQTLLAAVSTLK